MKKLLLIINPCSGKKKACRALADIVNVFNRGGYDVTVYATAARGDATATVARRAEEFDLVVCAGGDGTFNETISGLLEGGHRTPLGYLPAGSTNDFANSLHLSKDLVQAARDIVEGKPRMLDVGRFNDRYFSYVASFGAFTRTSYATSQSVKNALGHLAYILGGIKEIPSIRSRHLKFTLGDGVVLEDDYIFGAVSNSTSLAGILTLNPKLVDMSDGRFELLLVKAPNDLIDLAEIVYMLNSQNYESNKLVFINGSEFKIHADKDTSWSLDGEYQEGCEEIEIKNLHHAIELMMAGHRNRGGRRHE